LVEGLSAFKELFEKAEERSKKFSSAFRQAAESTGCLMLDAAEIVRPSPVDGVHLSPESHMLLAEHLAQYIQELFPKKGEG
jgi:lysophospholipase L1-like esterase